MYCTIIKKKKLRKIIEIMCSIIKRTSFKRLSFLDVFFIALEFRFIVNVTLYFSNKANFTDKQNIWPIPIDADYI